jgi:hypothetical protein
MPGDNENHRNISHHGIKTSQGFAAHVDVSAGTEQPPGLLSMVPLGAGRSSPFAPVSAARPAGEPAQTTVPHDPAPHPYTPAAQKQRPNTYVPMRKP